MGIIRAAIESFGGRVGAVQVSETDEWHWKETGFWPYIVSQTGIPVTPALALQVSCIFRGVRLIAEPLASLPLILYRERDDGGKDRARDHFWWPILRRRPNPWQTDQQWRETMTAHAVLWGIGMSEIKFTGRSAELWPLDPDTTVLEQLRSGRVRAVVQNEDGSSRIVTQDNLFRLEGLGLHAFMPVNLVMCAREAVGLWLAIEKHNAMFFLQGGKPSIALEHPGTLTEPAQKRLRETIASRLAGVSNMFKVFVAEEGMQVKPFGFSAKDAQMTESRDSMVGECARWIGMPEYMLGGSKPPPLASAVELARQFVDYTLAPWGGRWKASVGRDLIAEDEVFAEVLLDALLRGNTPERFAAYATAIQNGFMSENEVRIRENLNPVEGLDEPRRSVNQDRGEDPRRSEDSDRENTDERSGARARVPERRLRLIARRASERLVKRELAAIEKQAAKLAGDRERWEAWLEKHYADHSELIMETLELEPSVARAYCDRHRQALLEGGMGTAEDWETESVDALTVLALEEETVHA